MFYSFSPRLLARVMAPEFFPPEFWQKMRKRSELVTSWYQCVKLFTDNTDDPPGTKVGLNLAPLIGTITMQTALLIISKTNGTTLNCIRQDLEHGGSKSYNQGVELDTKRKLYPDYFSTAEPEPKYVGCASTQIGTELKR